MPNKHGRAKLSSTTNGSLNRSKHCQVRSVIFVLSNSRPFRPFVAPERALRPSHSRDLMSMLVSIYGHAELFIEEYVHMLADRMLSGQSNKVHIDNENRYVDILKQRFGDAGLQGCDVMLRDFADSSMINQLIEKELKAEPCSAIPTNTLIISREYWPEVKFSPIELPKQLTTIQDAYTKAYEGLKSHRTLHWSPNYGKLVSVTMDRVQRILPGQVHLEIEIGGKTLDFSVTPFHAAIIYKFLDKGKSTIERWFLSVSRNDPCLLRYVDDQ